MQLRPRLSLTQTTGLTLAGDLLCIGLFIAAGVLQHSGVEALPVRVPAAAAPFVVGWLAVGAFVGVFTEAATADSRTAATRAAVAWGGAAVVGQGLRATAVVSGGVALAFFVVSLLVGGSLLVGWRTVAARLIAG